MKKLFCVAIISFLAAGTIFAANADVQDNFAKWREWITLKQDYLDKVESLMERGNEIEMQQAADLQDAMKNSGRTADNGKVPGWLYRSFPCAPSTVAG